MRVIFRFALRSSDKFWRASRVGFLLCSSFALILMQLQVWSLTVIVKHEVPTKEVFKNSVSLVLDRVEKPVCLFKYVSKSAGSSIVLSTAEVARISLFLGQAVDELGAIQVGYEPTPRYALETITHDGRPKIIASIGEEDVLSFYSEEPSVRLYGCILPGLSNMLDQIYNDALKPKR